MSSEDRGQTEVLGSLLAVAIAAVLVVSVGTWLVAGIDTGAEPLLSADLAATSGNVTITHAGGEEFNATELRVVLREGANDTARFLLSSEPIDGDSDLLFEPGESVTRAHDSNGSAIAVLIVHEPTNSLLVDEDVGFGSSGSGYTGNNPAPSASFAYSPSNPTTGESIGFDASDSSDADGRIVSYEWDWTGDGTYDATGETINHSYADNGTYTVELRVTDDHGTTDTTTESVTVSSRPPAANFTYSPSDPTTGESIAFDASNSSDPDGSIASYEWDFTDDGSYDDTGQTVDHSYPDDGTYTVELRVTDDDGATNVTTATVTVSEGASDTTSPTVSEFADLTADKDSNEVTVGTLEVEDGGSGLGSVEIEVRPKGESEVIGSEQLAVSEGAEEAEWQDVVVSTSGIQPNREYEVTVIVTDVAGNTRSETKTVEDRVGGGGGRGRSGGGGPPGWTGT